MAINTKAITKALTVHLKNHKDSLENKAFHQIHVKEDGTTEYATSTMLIRFVKGIFMKTVILDTRTKGQIEKGITLPTLDFLNANFPKNTDRLFVPNIETNKNISEKEFDLTTLLKTVKEFEKKSISKPSGHKYHSVSFYFDSKEFVAITKKDKETNHLEFDADHLVRVLQSMKALGDETVKIYFHDGKPARPFEIHSSNAKALIAPIRFW